MCKSGGWNMIHLARRALRISDARIRFSTTGKSKDTHSIAIDYYTILYIIYVFFALLGWINANAKRSPNTHTHSSHSPARSIVWHIVSIQSSFPSQQNTLRRYRFENFHISKLIINTYVSQTCMPLFCSCLLCTHSVLTRTRHQTRRCCKLVQQRIQHLSDVHGRAPCTLCERIGAVMLEMGTSQFYLLI